MLNLVIYAVKPVSSLIDNVKRSTNTADAVCDRLIELPNPCKLQIHLVQSFPQLSDVLLCFLAHGAYSKGYQCCEQSSDDCYNQQDT